MFAKGKSFAINGSVNVDARFNFSPLVANRMHFGMLLLQRSKGLPKRVYIIFGIFG
jgi:hypothetical protein